MTLEASQEPKIWSFPVDGTCPQVQPFSLVELMHGIPNHENYLVRRGSCLVRGVHSMPKTEEEFDAIIKGETNQGIETVKKDRPDVEFTNEQLERLTLLLRAGFCTRHTNSLRAFRYVDVDGRSIADGLPYQGIITDTEWLAILFFDTPQEVTVLPYGDPKDGPHRNLFYDAHGKIAASRWGYTGDLATALSEIGQSGFTFNLAKLPSNLQEQRVVTDQYLDQLVNRKISGIITDANLPLKQVLTIIANPPI